MHSRNCKKLPDARTTAFVKSCICQIIYSHTPRDNDCRALKQLTKRLKQLNAWNDLVQWQLQEASEMRVNRHRQVPQVTRKANSFHHLAQQQLPNRKQLQCMLRRLQPGVFAELDGWKLLAVSLACSTHLCLFTHLACLMRLPLGQIDLLSYLDIQTLQSWFAPEP